MRQLIFLLISHGAAVAIGFALGIYFLPILTAPPAPDAAVLEQTAQDAQYTAQFDRELRGSDFLHWGEGTVSLTPTKIVHEGRLAPGPDYKLYLVREFVEHEDDFLPLKDASPRLGDIKSFEGFIVDVPEDVNVDDYNTVLVWCETFGEFITAAKYR
ncbi:DM13 domain-containing protein [Hoeflea sp.]|uniref:DM13 domain-containing protein n=1 Tax=Hoeflea sp. TaxID=1940281 RepID=UPI003B02A5A8